jgi:hypothetical protein
MKKLIAVAVCLLFINPISSHASTPKTMAIIDTGVDMTNNSIKNNIVHEVCFAGYNSCPNGKTFMDGAGSASLNSTMSAVTAWIHGTEVASAAIQTDSNVKIIEIRCASLIGASGFINCNNTLLGQALNWVYANASIYNIGAVVSPLSLFTQGSCYTDATISLAITNLYNSGIPAIFPTGNDFNYTNISSPACLPNALAISAIDDKGRLALYADYSSRVDFAANGNLTVAINNNQTKADSGTSLSVGVFGAGWLKIVNAKNLSYKDTYSIIKNTGTSYTNIMVKVNVTGINLANALR